jgi:hypothetical protein
MTFRKLGVFSRKGVAFLLLCLMTEMDAGSEMLFSKNPTNDLAISNDESLHESQFLQ